MSDTTPIHLFSYGTLQQEGVQMATFGRVIGGTPDAMLGYRRALLEITDPDVLAASGERFHPILVPSDDPADAIEGVVFALTADELRAADAYEVNDYARTLVTLRSGLEAWVYVQADAPQ